MKRILLVGLLVVAACAGSEQRVDGVVVAVDGGLSGVASFDIVTPGGARLRFVPDEGVESFVSGAPLSHLNEHLQTGAPVRITYRDEGDRLVALEVTDAP